MRIPLCWVLAAVFCFILIGIPHASATDCPAGCSCMLPAEARQMGYEACSGKLTLCGYDLTNTAKYCYTTTRSTQSSGSALFAEGECRSCTSGGITLLQGATLAQLRSMASSGGMGEIPASLYGEDSLVCVYALPGTCKEGDPCKITLKVIRASDAASAQNIMDTYSPPGNIAAVKSRLPSTDVTDTAAHRSIVFHNIPGGSDPVATNLALTMIYRDTYVIDAETDVSTYWVGSDASGKTILDGLESCGKSIVDRNLKGTAPASVSRTISPSGITTRRTTAPPAAISPSSGTSPGDLAQEDEPSLETLGLTPEKLGGNLMNGFTYMGDGFNRLSPVDVNWPAVPDAVAGSLTPAALGALGALIGGSAGALTLLPAGFAWPGTRGGDGGSGGPEELGGGVTWDDDSPPGRSAAEVVAEGVKGPDAFERAVMEIGRDSVDRVSEKPLPESPGMALTDSPAVPTGNTVQGDLSLAPPADLSSTGGSSEAGPVAGGAGSPERPVVTELPAGGSKADPSESELVNPETPEGDLEAEVTGLEQLQDLQLKVDGILKDKISQGYTVINPDWIRIWHRSILAGHLFYIFPSVYDVTEYIGLQAPRGRCGEFAAWGADWIKQDATRIFGEGTYVEKIGLNPDGWSNHQATHITTPQGQKYVVDFWEGTHNGSTRIYTEAEWMDKWKETLGRDVPVERNLMERNLEKIIRTHGEENGLEIFREMYSVNPAQTETIIQGYKQHPWFRIQ